LAGDNAVRLDISRVFKGAVGGHGIDEARLDELAPRAAEAAKAVQSKRGQGMLGFMELPFKTEYLESSRSVWGEVKAENPQGIDDLVVLGIGGSSLGMICLKTALLSPLHNESADAPTRRAGAPRIWVLDNIDPDWVGAHFDLYDPAKTVFNVISKSGTTAETMSQFLVARKMLEDKLGADCGKHVVCTTDSEKGRLRQIATDEGLKTLVVPDGVGGRWSVLSPVGLFPAVAVGIDCDALLKGAADMDERCRGGNLWENPGLMQAALLYLAQERGMNMHVMMPYSNALRDYADWYRQLLAESLGKKLARDGATVNAGLTPVKALGATDQHSQSQLYVEGPYDKYMTLVAVEKFGREVPLPSVYPDVEGVGYLGGASLAKLIDAERRGTEVALVDAGRPVSVVRVPEVTAYTLGQLFAFAEMSVAYCGELLNVNAFDQPGVEAAKVAAYGLMGRAGYEDVKAKIEKAPPPGEKYVL
jgi:glucose-6-phosphate isomerase